MSGKPSNGLSGRTRRNSPLVESLENRQMLSISASGGVFSNKDRVFTYETPTGGHATIKIIGIGNLAGTSVDDTGAVHIVFSGTNTYSKITGSVQGGDGLAPLASIVNSQLSDAGQSQSLSGVGGNVLQSVLLGKFDLVPGGTINLTSGVNALSLDSVGADTQIELRELPSTIQPSTLQAEIKSAATSGTSSSTSTSSSSSTSTSKSSSSSSSSTSTIPLQDTGTPYTYTSSQGVSTTYVKSADGAVTLTAASGSFTAGSNIVESLSPGQPPSLPPAPPGVILKINRVQGTLAQPVNLQTDSQIFGYDPATGRLLRFDLNLETNTGTVDPTFPTIVVPGSPAAVGLNLGWNGSQLDVLVSSGTTVYAYNATTGAAVGSFTTTYPTNSIGSTDTVTVLGSYVTNTLYMINLPLSLQTGVAQPATGDPKSLTPTSGLTLLGGLTGIAGSNSIYASVAGTFDSLHPLQPELGMQSVSTVSVARSPSFTGPFYKFNSYTASATFEQGYYIPVTANPPNSSQQGAGLGSVDQSLAMLEGLSNGANTLSLSSGIVALDYPNLLGAVSESFRTGLSGAAIIDVQGDVQSFRGQSAAGLVLNDTGNLNLVKLDSLSNSTIVGQPISHLEIKSRSASNVLSTKRDVGTRNGVDVSNSLQPIGPITQTGD